MSTGVYIGDSNILYLGIGDNYYTDTEEHITIIPNFYVLITIITDI